MRAVRLTLGCAAVMAASSAAPASAAVRCVPVFGPGCDSGHTAIVNAIAAAADGDTIRLAPGSWTAPPGPISKRLWFEGAGAGTLAAFDPKTQTQIIGTINAPGLTLAAGGSVHDARLLGGPATSGNPGQAGLVLAGAGALSYELRSLVAIGSASNGGGSSGSQALHVDATGGSLTTTVADAAFAGGPGGQRAVVVDGGDDDATSISGSRIVAQGQEGLALEGGTADLRESTIEARDGLVAESGADVRLQRSRVLAGFRAILNEGDGSTPTTVEVRDSLLVADGTGARAIAAFSLSEPATVLVRGSTVLARGAGQLTAVSVSPGPPGGGPVAVDLRNTVARVDGGDPGSAALRADTHAITADFSSFASAVAVDGGSVPAVGSASNLAADPLLGPELAPLPGSPLVDRGDPAAVVAGEQDLVGAPRSLDGDGDCRAVPDIGAFELAANPAGCAAGPPAGSASGSPNPAPAVRSFRIADPAFAVAPKRSRAKLDRQAASGTESARRGVPRGSRFLYVLSEPARVTIAIERAAPGRRVGGRCLAPSRRHSRHARCTRWLAVGTLRAPGRAGRQSLPFSGRLGGRALRPGKHRARLVAVDALGARSAERRVAFRIITPTRRAK